MKHRCRFCREYGDVDEMVNAGLSYFCSTEEMFEHEKLRVLRAAERKRSRSINPETGVIDGLSEFQRAEIKASDGNRCRYCGGFSNLAVHHIVYRSDRSNREFENDPSNLITLCNRPCHLDIVHGNKELYQPLCRRIVWLRETYGDKVTLIKNLEKENET